MRRPVSYAERKRRKAYVDAYMRTCGWWVQDGNGAVTLVAICTKCGAPTRHKDMTAGHVVSVAEGGSEGGALRAECRQCQNVQGGALSRMNK